MGVFPSIADVTTIRTSGLYPYGDHSSQQEGISLPKPGSFPLAGWLGDLIRVDIDYILEIYDQGKMVTATVLPQTPTSVKAKRSSATKVDYTLGIEPIRHHALNRRVDIELRGKTGVQTRQGYSRNGKLITKRPLELMLEFDAFLDKYQQIATKAGANKYMYPEGLSNRDDSQPFGNYGTYLVLRCLDERLHVKVEPLVWEWDRNAERTRLGSDWTLSLQAYAPTSPKKPGGFLGKFQAYVDVATAYVAAVNNCIATANSAMDSVNQGLHGIREPLKELTKTGAALRQFLHTSGQIADFPRGLAADALMAAGQFYAAASDAVLIGQALDAGYTGLASSPLGGFNDKGRRSISSAAEEAYIFAETSFGAAGLGPDTADAATAAYEDKIAGGLEPSATDNTVYLTGEADLDVDFGYAGDVIVYTMSAGDSLPYVVQDYYTSPGGLGKVLAYNGLQDPFTWKTGAPLQPGDKLLFPGTGLSNGGMFYSKTGDIDDMYGRDLFLDAATGDLVVREDGLDARTVRGPDNLEQALTHRCRTSQGTSRNFPQYGIPFAPGDVIQASLFGYLGAHINEQMLRDQRIAGIKDLVFSDEGDTLPISFTALSEVGTGQPVAASLR